MKIIASRMNDTNAVVAAAIFVAVANMGFIV